MNLSAPFINRPVATTLLTIAIAIAGAIAYTVLPVSPLPQVDFPTISVSGSLPGASARIMASSFATPLERRSGHIARRLERQNELAAGLSKLTSASLPASPSTGPQFAPASQIDGAGKDVEAAVG